MHNRNLFLREQMKTNNINFWMVAEKMNMNDGNFSRLLRKELTKEKANEILKIIEQLKEEQENAGT